MDLLEQLKASSLSTWLSMSMAGAPTLIALHSVGMAVVVGLSLMTTLRLYGLLPGLDARLLPRLLNVAVWGFGLNLVTGIGIFLTRAPDYARSTTFGVKMLLVLVSAVLLLWLRRHLKSSIPAAAAGAAAAGPAAGSSAARGPVAGGLPGVDPSRDRIARAVSAAATTTWFAAVVAGRMIAYLSDLYR